MKIFDSKDGWTDRVNFVDDNNVAVGYDMSSCCCENFGWFISDEIESDIREDEGLNNIDDYEFDPSFVEWPTPEDKYNEASIVVFRLTSDCGGDRYLHLFNCHNGYYSHGFSFKSGDSEIESGSL